MRVWWVKFVTAPVLMLVIASFTACGGGDDESRFTQVAAGANHTCALRSNGSVVCWGRDNYGQLRVPVDDRFTAITAGGVHNCGMRSDGTAICWGHFSGLAALDEELARAATADGRYHSPFPPEEERFTKIAAGGEITCGIRTEGDVACWTYRGNAYSPFGPEEVLEIDPGGEYVCGLRPDGTVLCDNLYVGPVLDEEQFVAISTASSNACGLRSDGVVLCWGINNAGQAASPVDGPFSAIGAGAYHTCGLRLDGTAVCWGYDFDEWEKQMVGGSVPNQSTLDEAQRLRDIPISPPPDDERFTAIAIGTLHTCGLRMDGGVSCWGYNHHGQASPPGDDD